MPTYLLTNEVLNVSVSRFANYATPDKPVTIELLTWLFSKEYLPKLEAVRLIEDKVKRDAEKATIPAITPSAVFTYRQASCMVAGSHTRLIQFDIDQKDNRHIRNYDDLKAQISKLPFVAYCALSASGKGYWGLVPIAYPERHGQHFDALTRVFAHYGVNIDTKPRNVASLRGYSYDHAPHLPERVMVFELYDEPPKPRPFEYSRFRSRDDSQLLPRIIRLIENATDGGRHDPLLRASRLAGGYIGAGRLDEQSAVHALESVVTNWPDSGKHRKTIRDGIRYGMAVPITEDEQTNPTPVQVTTQRQVGKAQLIVKTIADQLANPGSILKPDESQLERLTVESCDTYPAEIDAPSEPSAVPTIRVHNSASYFRMQREHKDFSRLGLASLKTEQQG